MLSDDKRISTLPRILWHKPRTHASHKYACGCCDPDDAVFVCKNCGATYDNTPVSFVRFVCYDCKVGVFTDPLIVAAARGEGWYKSND